MNDNRIGEKIKTMRLSRGMNQDEVAQKCGVSRPTVALWESGRRIPLMQNIEALADCFNVPASAFLEQPSSKEVRQALIEGRTLHDLRESARDNPDLLLLFDLMRTASPEVVKSTIDFARFVLKKEDRDG